MKQVIKLEDKTVVLIYQDLDDDIDVDQLLQIDYTNIYGEILTNSVILNKVGMLRADTQALYDLMKMNANIFEANLRKKYRREALLNGGKVRLEDEGSIKLTESSLDEIVSGDLKLQSLKKQLIESKKDLEYMDSLFWSLKSKDQKLNLLVPKVTPQELYDELIEGTINTITIKKM